MKRLLLLFAVAALAFSPLMVSPAKAAGLHKNKAHHQTKHPGKNHAKHHGKHHRNG